MTIKESLRINITVGERWQWQDSQRIVEITGIGPKQLVRYRRVIDDEMKGDETKAGIGYFLSHHKPVA